MKYKKICAACGCGFETDDGRRRYCDGSFNVECRVCGKPIAVKCRDLKRHGRCCSPKCSNLLCRMHFDRRKCRECGRMFAPSSGAEYICHGVHTRTCAVCGASFRISREGIHAGRITCSDPCRAELAKRRNIEKYGSAHPMGSDEVKRRKRRTMLERYGGGTTFESKILMRKVEDSNIGRYGHANAASSPAIRRRIDATNIERYGHRTPLLDENIQSNIRATKMAVIEGKRSLALDEFTRFMRNGMGIHEMARRLFEGYGYAITSGIDPFMREYSAYLNGKFAYSDGMRLRDRIIGMLKDAGIGFDLDVETGECVYPIAIMDEHAVICPREIRECNSIFGIDAQQRPSMRGNAHLHGYTCIYAYPWDNLDAVMDAVIPPSKILSIDDCRVMRSVTPEHEGLARMFIRSNHVLGTARGALAYVYLVCDDEIVAAMSICRSRYNAKWKYEISRMCKKIGYKVDGWAARLLEFLIDGMEVDSIMAYCDASKPGIRTWAGTMMDHVHDVPPRMVWARGDKMITGNLLRRVGFENLFNVHDGDASNCNEYMMLENGWLPMYDCGLHVFAHGH